MGGPGGGVGAAVVGASPPITTVTAPGTELGRLGVETLLRQLDGGTPLTPVLRAGVLALGESTGPIHEKAGLQ